MGSLGYPLTPILGERVSGGASPLNTIKKNEFKDGLLSRVNEALSDTYTEDYEDLESAVEALIEEYDDLKEETEDRD